MPDLDDEVAGALSCAACGGIEFEVGMTVKEGTISGYTPSVFRCTKCKHMTDTDSIEKTKPSHDHRTRHDA